MVYPKVRYLVLSSFTLYIIDLPKCAPLCQTFLYTDDAVISFPDLNILVDSANNIHNWCTKNLLHYK